VTADDVVLHLLRDALPYVRAAAATWDEWDGESGNRARQAQAAELEARIRTALNRAVS